MGYSLILEVHLESTDLCRGQQPTHPLYQLHNWNHQICLNASANLLEICLKGQRDISWPLNNDWINAADYHYMLTSCYSALQKFWFHNHSVIWRDHCATTELHLHEGWSLQQQHIFRMHSSFSWLNVLGPSAELDAESYFHNKPAKRQTNKPTKA